MKTTIALIPIIACASLCAETIDVSWPSEWKNAPSSVWNTTVQTNYIAGSNSGAYFTREDGKRDIRAAHNISAGLSAFANDMYAGSPASGNGITGDIWLHFSAGQIGNAAASNNTGNITATLTEARPSSDYANITITEGNANYYYTGDVATGLVWGGGKADATYTTVTSNVEGGRVDTVNKSEVKGSTNIYVDGNAKVSGILGGGLSEVSTRFSGTGSLAGSVYSGANVGSTNITIAGGTVNNYIIAGGRTEAGTGTSTLAGANTVIVTLEARVLGNTNLKITGGTVGSGAYDIYGGGRTSSAWGDARVMGNTNITISGGTVNANIFGGGNRLNNAGNADVEGNTNITVSGGKINGNIYGGGDNGANVKGDSTITFKGDASKLSFTGTVYGGGRNGSVVEGTKTLNFGTVSGAFSGEFHGKTSGFDSINIAANSTLTWANYGATTNDSAINNHGALHIILDAALDAAGAAIDVTNAANAKFSVHGGYLKDGTLYLGEQKSVVIDVAAPVVVAETITHEQSTTISFTNDAQENVMTLSFSVAEGNTAAFNSMEDITASSGIDDVIVAWDFDITMGENDSVVLSFLIGDVDLDASRIILYHDGEDVSENIMGYDGQYLTFLADSFSTWAVALGAPIPEPSTYAAIFGAIALGFAAYRRRARK